MIMILNSLQNGPLVWPTIVEEDGTTRTKKYEELSVTKKLQPDCYLKATNIVLQGLPPDVYAIVNHHKVSKEIWDRVKLLMQGTKLSLQEKECKLEDLETLWKLIKAKYGNTRLEEAYERVLWGDLKVMFEPDIEKKRYHLTPATITEMLIRKLQDDLLNKMCYRLLKLMLKQQKKK
uniref:Integrase, catalytic region, zinc finger, CCHC-type, peptidase aspartic, catalytic n=1 Tax=Tanacetum cinerariifolium TaxID=118510 RepID=A0A6L2LLH6_TANCI|nr:hypothetical protein [Tanacetum cinerariifolium]